jgi:hypothetical protein
VRYVSWYPESLPTPSLPTVVFFALFCILLNRDSTKNQSMEEIAVTDAIGSCLIYVITFLLVVYSFLLFFLFLFMFLFLVLHVSPFFVSLYHL